MKPWRQRWALIHVVVVYAIANAAIPAPAAKTTWAVTNRQVYVNGQPFLMRGVGYQPTPIGENPSTSAPNGDYYTPKYQAIYVRDLQNLRDMGANAVRIYGWNELSNHVDFLDKAWNGGTNPVYVLLNKYVNPGTVWTSTAAVNAIRDTYVAIVTNVNNHPAVMGFGIGNELNIYNGNGANSNFWNAMNFIGGAVKAAASTKLVGVVNADDAGSVANFNASMTNMDVWFLQIYRGQTFGTLFSSYSNASTKPMFITEFGIDAFNNAAGQEYPNNAQIVADYFEGLWREILTNRPIDSGGCVFSYSDEWWKYNGGNSTNHDTGGGSNVNFPDGVDNSEWWGIYSVATNGTNLNVLTPRALFYKIKDLWRAPDARLNAAIVSSLAQIDFPRRTNRFDVLYEVEGSQNLTNWTAVVRSTAAQTATNTVAGTYSIFEAGSTNNENTVTVQSTITANALTNVFYRLRIKLD